VVSSADEDVPFAPSAVWVELVAADTTGCGGASFALVLWVALSWDDLLVSTLPISVGGVDSRSSPVSDVDEVPVLVELVCAPPLLLTTTPGASCEVAVVDPDVGLPVVACAS
jgi:hypothetical protein